MKLPSASNLQRAIACEASSLLRQVDAEVPQAHWGQGVHSYLENVNKVGRHKALLAIEDHELRAYCEGLDLDVLPVDPNCYAVEVTFAYDFATDTARELGRGIGRNYAGAKPTEFVGTADVVGVSADGNTVYIPDYKTGWYASLQRPADSWQLKALALFAARAYGADSAVVELILLREDGTSKPMTARLDIFDLDIVAKELRELAERLKCAQGDYAQGKQPTMKTGEHCRYCRSRVFCPAQTALVREMVAPVPYTMPAITTENAPHLWATYRQMEWIVEQVRDALCAYARTSPFQLPSGLTVGEVKTVRESVDGPVAHRVLADMYGPEVAAAACEVTSSKKAVEEAIRGVAAANGEKLVDIKRRTFSAISEAGGITRKATVQVKEHRGK
jgi:hypothetical protein